MKKQLIKEVLDINKLLKKEEKQKNESNIEIKNLEQEINSIEDKLKSIIKNQNEYDKLPKISILAKLYEKSKKINREKTFIENNLIQFKKENESKEAKLEKYFRDLKEKEIKNDELIEKKIDELAYEYERFQRRFPDEKKQEQYIISPETMSIHMISKITTEIDFMNTIRKQIKNIKFKNEKILKEIDSHLKKLYIMKSKKESSAAELSTTAKNSSHLEKKNYILHQLENLNNNININNEIQDSTSSISMEIETNLNLDNLPSDDESLRFIDKVFDIKSNIKPIKNKIKTQFFPPSASIPMEKTKKAEPIKIERPVDYKEKKENIEKKIEILKKEIEEKKAKIESFKTKRIKIEEDNNKKEENLKHANMKIKIIKDQIDVIKKQIEEFEENKNNDKYEYLRMFSICNIVNNRNYYLYNINNQNNVSDLETFRK
jgi:chromosome segregation ATPase